MKVNEYFSTNDLSLATVLSINFPILEVDNTNPRRVTFVFSKNKKIEEIIEKYWNGSLRVDPLQFSNYRKTLVARINEGGRNGNW